MIFSTVFFKGVNLNYPPVNAHCYDCCGFKVIESKLHPPSTRRTTRRRRQLYTRFKHQLSLADDAGRPPTISCCFEGLSSSQCSIPLATSGPLSASSSSPSSADSGPSCPDHSRSSPERTQVGLCCRCEWCLAFDLPGGPWGKIMCWYCSIGCKSCFLM